MPRFVPIRITKNDRKEYARLVRNTKAKIRRTSKKYGIDLSTEVNIPDIESFRTRKEFNKWKQQMQSFTNRSNLRYQFQKNPYGVVASKAEILRIERDTRRAQRIARQMQEEVQGKPFISGGKQQGTVGQRMLQMQRPSVGGISVPADFDFSKIRTQQQLQRKAESMARKADPDYYDERKERMKENFIKMLEESFNSDADELIREIQSIPADDFFEMYLMFDEFSFDLYYEVEGVEGSGGTMRDINRMLSYIDRYKSGKIDMDLKGF